jgi:hypothetical protein
LTHGIYFSKLLWLIVLKGYRFSHLVQVLGVILWVH